jgi:hypothetical protein
MSLFNVQRDATQEPKPYIGAGWKKLKLSLLRIFDREREMIRLRVAMGMMSEARQSDASEYREMREGARLLSERVRQLEEERAAWRDAKKADKAAMVKP